jgi:hypothetical protein
MIRAMRTVPAILAAALFGLVGCSTPAGTSYTEMSVSFPPLKPGEGRIFFYTPARFGGNQPEVRLDGRLIGFAIPSGFFFVDRPAGRYEATGVTAADGRIELPLAAGETKYVRAQAPSAFSVNAVHFLLVPAPEGRGDMAGLAYSGIRTAQ